MQSVVYWFQSSTHTTLGNIHWWGRNFTAHRRCNSSAYHRRKPWPQNILSQGKFCIYYGTFPRRIRICNFPLYWFASLERNTKIFCRKNERMPRFIWIICWQCYRRKEVGILVSWRILSCRTLWRLSVCPGIRSIVCIQHILGLCSTDLCGSRRQSN